MQPETRPLTDAEVAAFKKQINSPLLKRFLRTIDDLSARLEEREREIKDLRAKRRRF